MNSRWIFYSLFFFNHILHSQTFSVQVDTEDIGTLKKTGPVIEAYFFGGDGAENRFAATHYYQWSPEFPVFVNLIDRAGEESNGKRILKYRNGARFAGNKYRALGAFRSTGDALLGYFLDVKTNDFYSIQFDEEGSPQEKDVTRLTDFGEKKKLYSRYFGAVESENGEFLLLYTIFREEKKSIQKAKFLLIDEAGNVAGDYLADFSDFGHAVFYSLPIVQSNGDLLFKVSEAFEKETRRSYMRWKDNRRHYVLRISSATSVSEVYPVFSKEDNVHAFTLSPISAEELFITGETKPIDDTRTSGLAFNRLNLETKDSKKTFFSFGDMGDSLQDYLFEFSHDCNFVNGLIRYEESSSSCVTLNYKSKCVEESDGTILQILELTKKLNQDQGDKIRTNGMMILHHKPSTEDISMRFVPMRISSSSVSRRESLFEVTRIKEGIVVGHPDVEKNKEVYADPNALSIMKIKDLKDVFLNECYRFWFIPFDGGKLQTRLLPKPDKSYFLDVVKSRFYNASKAPGTIEITGAKSRIIKLQAGIDLKKYKYSFTIE